MSYRRLFYHLVWATKNREPVIDEDVQALVERSFQLTSADLGLRVHARGFMPEHVHLSMSIPPTIAVTDVVRRLKGASSHGVNRAKSAPVFGRQDGFGVQSFGEKNLSQVNAYILNQKEHHARGTLIAALERDNDGRYRDMNSRFQPTSDHETGVSTPGGDQ
jgi:REP element-mobilizing transposase RayT